MPASEVFRQALRQFARNQQPGAPDLTQARAKRLQRVLRHASKRVPMYRDLYRGHGIDVETMTTPEDLWRLPSVSKPDYVRVGPQAYTDRYESLLDAYEQSTSGSLGQTLKMYAQPSEADLMLASLWAGWVGAGVTPNDRLFMLSAPYLAENVRPFTRFFIPVQMPIEDVVENFRAFEPTVVLGMTETVALLSVELKRRDIPQRRGVRAVFPFGQTYSEQLRRMITSGFDAEVFDLYGAAECGWLGYDCDRHNGLHVPEGRIIVQVARIGQPDTPADGGEQGELIVTSLLRLTTPFIRYRLFDVAALDSTPCACGRTSPRIVNLEGRIHDFLIATDGRWVASGTLAIDLWVGRPALLDHAIVQGEPNHVQVSLVVDPSLPPIDAMQVQALVRRHLGPVEVNVAFVNELPREPSGKRRRIYRTFDLPETDDGFSAQDRHRYSATHAAK